MRAPNIHSRLTIGQVRLLERHRGGIARLAMALAQKRCCRPESLIVLLAQRSSQVGTAFGKHLELPTTNDVIVIPGLVRDLPRWLERLALLGPVHDWTPSGEGVAAIIIDQLGEMALCRVEIDVSAATVAPGTGR